jgi:YgiT-type zinc finger domain-containing protein
MTDREDNDTAQIQGLCPECQAGVMRLQYLTYFTWLNDELITVPNFPAWVCDVCGKREYDDRAIVWLNTLLNPETGRRKLARRKPGALRVLLTRPRPGKENAA